MKFDFEEQAYNNAPLPKELNSSDSFMFLCLRAIYQQLKVDTIDKKQAQKEKFKLENIYRKMVFREKLCEHSNKLYNRVFATGESLRKAINDEKACTEQAKAFYTAVYNGVDSFAKKGGQ